MAHANAAEAQKHYIKIWAILLGLLIVSIIGPEFGIPVVTMITAFGVALIKTYYVVRYFMHIGVEKKWIGYLMVTVLGLMAVFVGAVAPDVMKHDGHNWENVSSKQVVGAGALIHGKPVPKKGGDDHGHDHGHEHGPGGHDHAPPPAQGQPAQGEPGKAEPQQAPPPHDDHAHEGGKPHRH